MPTTHADPDPTLDPLLDPARLEEHAWRTSLSDGLLELCLGGGLAAYGITFLLEPSMAAITPVLVAPLWPGLRRKVTEPRLGRVRWSAGRRARERRKRLALAGFLLLTLLMGVAAFLLLGRAGAPLGGRDDGRLLFCTAIALLIGVVGWLERLPRFAVYALVVVAGGVVGRLGHFELGAHLLVSGLVILAAGVVMLARFLRDHPRIEEPAGDELL